MTTTLPAISVTWPTGIYKNSSATAYYVSVSTAPANTNVPAVANATLVNANVNQTVQCTDSFPVNQRMFGNVVNAGINFTMYGTMGIPSPADQLTFGLTVQGSSFITPVNMNLPASYLTAATGAFEITARLKFSAISSTVAGQVNFNSLFNIAWHTPFSGGGNYSITDNHYAIRVGQGVFNIFSTSVYGTATIQTANGTGINVLGSELEVIPS